MPSNINPLVPQNGSAWQGTKTNFATAKIEIEAIQATLLWVATLNPATGLIYTNQLGTGIADATKYLRGDGTWVAGTAGTTDHAALSNLDAAHAGHTGFEYTINKGALSGYAGLDAAGLVPITQLGTGIYNVAKYLRMDQTWAVPPGSGGGGSGGYFPGGWPGSGGVGTATYYYPAGWV